MAFKREKLHQNPSRDMTFGSIRATTCQACLVSPARTGHRADRAVLLAPCRSNGNRADRTVPLEREPCRSHRAARTGTVPIAPCRALPSVGGDARDPLVHRPPGRRPRGRFLHGRFSSTYNNEHLNGRLMPRQAAQRGLSLSTDGHRPASHCQKSAGPAIAKDELIPYRLIPWRYYRSDKRNNEICAANFIASPTGRKERDHFFVLANSLSIRVGTAHKRVLTRRMGPYNSFRH